MNELNIRARVAEGNLDSVAFSEFMYNNAGISIYWTMQ